jgi:hypothetical protein
VSSEFDPLGQTFWQGLERVTLYYLTQIQDIFRPSFKPLYKYSSHAHISTWNFILHRLLCLIRLIERFNSSHCMPFDILDIPYVYSVSSQS